MGSKTLTSLSDHKYYGPLIDLYTKNILKSGLLLDEDLEVLLNISNFSSVSPVGGYKPSISILASILSALSCSLVAKRSKIPLIVVPSMVFLVKSLVTEIRTIRRIKNDREIVDKLIEVIKKTHTLNLSIIRYMKSRTDLANTKHSFLTLYNKSIKEFLESLLKNECEFFLYAKNNLKSISKYSRELYDDYKCLISLNPLIILETKEVDNIQDCLALTRNIQDLHILFASKLLSYLGIVCCSKTSSLHDNDLDDLLNKTLYNAVKYFQQHHDTVRKQFVVLRQSVNKKYEYTSQAKVKTSSGRQIQTKLKETLVCSVNNLSVILEKSQNVLDAVENDDAINLNEIGNAIVDLKNHTFAAYETLDVLCKLYGILANTNVRNEGQNKIIPVKNKENVDQPLPVISCDDSTEPLEEKFELYIGKEDFDKESSSVKYDHDRSDEYLSLMLKELRQSLRQHQRFIDAKNRRGSDDGDIIRNDSLVELRKSPPKFNLSVVNCGSQFKDITALTEQKEISAMKLPVASPPTPPPPPTFQFNNLEEESGQLNTRSMLDNIKALSSQRNTQEEVFGDSDIDNSGSTDDCC